MRNLSSQSRKTKFHHAVKPIQEQMIDRVVSHPAYKTVTLEEISHLLQNKAPFTYVLSSTEQKYHFHLSHVKGDGSIEHRHFQIKWEMNAWIYRNSCSWGYESLDQFIPYILGCNPSKTTPLI